MNPRKRQTVQKAILGKVVDTVELGSVFWLPLFPLDTSSSSH